MTEQEEVKIPTKTNDKNKALQCNDVTRKGFIRMQKKKETTAGLWGLGPIFRQLSIFGQKYVNSLKDPSRLTHQQGCHMRHKKKRTPHEPVKSPEMDMMKETPEFGPREVYFSFSHENRLFWNLNSTRITNLSLCAAEKLLKKAPNRPNKGVSNNHSLPLSTISEAYNLYNI